MEIQHFVNTMVSLTGKHTKILCDPWITTNTDISRYNIYNYPPLKLTTEEIAAKGFTHLYISHSHPDHFCPDTLKTFPREIPVLIFDWTNNYLERSLKFLGFKNILTVSWEKGIDLGNGDYMWAKASSRDKDVDSMAVLRVDGNYCLNTNDCVFVEEEARAVSMSFPNLDVAFVAAAAGSSYPQFFTNLNHEEKIRAAENRKQNNLNNFCKQIQIYKPKVAFPFGGGILHGGKKASQHKYQGVASFREVKDFVSHCQSESEIVVLPPLGRYDMATRETLPPEQNEMSDVELESYRQEVEKKQWIFDKGQDFYIAPHMRICLFPLLQVARMRLRKW